MLSMKLNGMVAGSLLLGGVADIIGRRGTILGYLVVIAIGMFGASTAGGIVIQSVWRVVTGIGVGRGRSALAPALAGLLFAAGYLLPLVAMLMALGSLVAAFAILLLARASTVEQIRAT